MTVVLSPLDKKYVYQGITIFIYLGVANFIGGGNKEYYLCVQVCIKQEYYMYIFLYIVYVNSLHNKLFNLPARGTCANGIFTSPPYQDNFFQGLDQRLK